MANPQERPDPADIAAPDYRWFVKQPDGSWLEVDDLAAYIWRADWRNRTKELVNPFAKQGRRYPKRDTRPK